MSSMVAAGTPLIGMSAPAGSWTQRVREVGPGLGARRIFADLGSGATSQIKLVEQAHAAGMLPVISYKVGGDVAGAVAGRYNAVAEQAAAKLASYGMPTAVTFWHEPYGDMSGAQYAAASKQLLPIFKRGELRVGPLLNGWLLDNKLSTFASYCPTSSSRSGTGSASTPTSPGPSQAPGESQARGADPGAGRPTWSRAATTMPLGVGEYNGYSAQTIAAAGEALLSTPNVWFGCVWNSTGGQGLDAHRRASGRVPADPGRRRAARDRASRLRRTPLCLDRG